MWNIGRLAAACNGSSFKLYADVHVLVSLNGTDFSQNYMFVKRISSLRFVHTLIAYSVSFVTFPGTDSAR